MFFAYISIAILRTHESIIFQRLNLADECAFGCTFHLDESISICCAYITGKFEVSFSLVDALVTALTSS